MSNYTVKVNIGEHVVEQRNVYITVNSYGDDATSVYGNKTSSFSWTYSATNGGTNQFINTVDNGTITYFGAGSTTIYDKISELGNTSVDVTTVTTAKQGSVVESYMAYLTIGSYSNSTSYDTDQKYTAGTYTINMANYYVTVTLGEYKVTQRSITVTIADVTDAVYGTANESALTASITGGYDGETNSLYTLSVDDGVLEGTVNVGTYKISATTTTYGTTNYIITYAGTYYSNEVYGGTFTVNKATLVITPDDDKVTYGDDFTASKYTVSGWKNSDGTDGSTTTASDLLSVTFDYAKDCAYTQSSPVSGTYTIIIREVTSSTGNISTNYYFVYNSSTSDDDPNSTDVSGYSFSATLTVNAREITVDLNDITRHYNLNVANPQNKDDTKIGYLYYTSFINTSGTNGYGSIYSGDNWYEVYTISAVLSGTDAIKTWSSDDATTKYATATNDVGEYTISIKITNSNYVLSDEQLTATFTIEKAEVLFTFKDPSNTTYTGTAKSASLSFSNSSLSGSEFEFTITYYSDEDLTDVVPESKVIDVGRYYYTGIFTSKNYVSGSGYSWFDITAKTLTIDWSFDLGNTDEYDDSQQYTGSALTTTVTLTDYVNSEDGLSYKIIWVANDGDDMYYANTAYYTYTPIHAGSYTATIELLDGDGTAKASNYQLSTYTKNFTIEKRTVNTPYTSGDVTLTYTGASRSFTVTNYWVTSDSNLYNASTNPDSAVILIGQSVSLYDTSLTDYEMTEVLGTAASGNYSTLTLSAIYAGTYTITLSLANSDDYKWSSEPATIVLKIDRATLALPTVNTDEADYSGNYRTLTYTYSTSTDSNYNGAALITYEVKAYTNGSADSDLLGSVKNKHEMTATSTGGTLDVINAGTYTVTFSINNPNYTWNDENKTTADIDCSTTISKVPITIYANTQYITYGQAYVSATYGAGFNNLASTPLVGGDTSVTQEVTGISGELLFHAETGKKITYVVSDYIVGTAANTEATSTLYIDIENLTSRNYVIKISKTGVLVVNPYDLTITISDYAVDYNGSDQYSAMHDHILANLNTFFTADLTASDNLASLGIAFVETTTTKNADDYYFTFTTDNGNYNVTWSNAEATSERYLKFTINKIALTITIKDDTVTYGNSWSYNSTGETETTYSGWATGDSIESFVQYGETDNTTNYSHTYTTYNSSYDTTSYTAWDSHAGYTYTIGISGVTLDSDGVIQENTTFYPQNYTVTVKTGTLSVESRVVKLSETEYDAMFNPEIVNGEYTGNGIGQDVKLLFENYTATDSELSGLVLGTDYTLTYKAGNSPASLSEDEDGNRPVTVGNYSVSITMKTNDASSTDYVFESSSTTASATLTIEKFEISLSWAEQYLQITEEGTVSTNTLGGEDYNYSSVIMSIADSAFTEVSTRSGSSYTGTVSKSNSGEASTYNFSEGTLTVCVAYGGTYTVTITLSDEALVNYAWSGSSSSTTTLIFYGVVSNTKIEITVTAGSTYNDGGSVVTYTQTLTGMTESDVTVYYASAETYTGDDISGNYGAFSSSSAVDTWRKSNSSLFTTTAPSDAGTYIIWLYYAGSTSSAAASAYGWFVIEQATVSAPTQTVTESTQSLSYADWSSSTTYYYTGSAYSIQITYYSVLTYSTSQAITSGSGVTGYSTATYSCTDAASYTVTFSLPSSGNYKWVNTVETETVTLTFTITQATNGYVDDSETENVTYGYTGTTGYTSNFTTKATFGSVVYVYYDSESALLDSAPTDAGTYTVYATVTGNDNYTSIAVDTTGVNSFTLTINKATVDAPTLTTHDDDSNYTYTVTYSGSSYSTTLTGLTSLMSVTSTDATSTTATSQTISKTDAGTYSIVIGLADSSNYEWASAATTDNSAYSSTDNTLTFSLIINKLGITINVSMADYTYGSSASTPSISVTKTEGGDQWTALTNSLKYSFSGTANDTTSYTSNYTDTANGTAPTNAGSYKVTYTCTTSLDNYTITSNCAVDGSSNSWYAEFTVNRQSVATPTLSQSSFTYTGSTISVVSYIGGSYDSSIMDYTSETGSTYEATAVKDYSLIFTLSDTKNYEWRQPDVAGGATVTVTWSIKSAGELTITVEITGWTYGSYDADTNKLNVSFSIAGIDDNYTTKYYVYNTSSGEYEEYTDDIGNTTNAGNYYVTVSVEKGEGYSGTTSEAVYFTVEQREISFTVAVTDNGADGSITYGEGYTVSLTSIENTANSDTLTFTTTYTGNTMAGGAISSTDEAPTNAGYYYATVALSGESATNYTATAVTTAFTINKAKIEKPEEDTTTYTYTGSDQTYSLTKNANYTIDNATQTSAGTYTVSVTLNDTANYEWTDETTTAATYSFVIAQKTLTVNASDGTVTYGSSYSHPSDGYTFEGFVDGESTSNVTISGTVVFTVDYAVGGNNSDVGEHKEVIVISVSTLTADNYTIVIGSAGTLTVTGNATNTILTINGYSVTIDSDVAYYDGNVLTITITYGDTLTLTGTATYGTVEFTYSGSKTMPTDASDTAYTITASVESTESYSATSATFNLKIDRKQITTAGLSAQSGTVYYTGEELTVTTSYITDQSKTLYGEAGIYSVAYNGTDKIINAGDYSLTLTITDTNYIWLVDGSTSETATITYKVSQAITNTITGSTVYTTTYGTDYQSTFESKYSATFGTVSYYYTGTVNGGTENGYGSDSAPQNAGNYTVTVSVDATANYVGATCTVTLTVERITVALPYASKTSISYTGSVIDFVTDYVTLDEDYSSVITYNGTDSTPSATDLGDNYKVIFVLSDTNNYMWTGGSTSSYTITWAIVTNSSGISIDFTSQTFTYTYGESISIMYTVSLGDTPLKEGEYTATVYYQIDGLYTEAKPTEVGTYTVKVEVSGTSQYSASSAATTLTINKQTVTLKYNDAEGINITGWTYGSTANDPSYTVTSDVDGYSVSSIGLDIIYTGTTSSGYGYESTAVPTEAGDYTVTITLVDTDNFKFNNGSNYSTTFTISEKTITISVSSITGLEESTGVLVSGTVLAGSLTLDGWTYDADRSSGEITEEVLTVLSQVLVDSSGKSITVDYTDTVVTYMYYGSSNNQDPEAGEVWNYGKANPTSTAPTLAGTYYVIIAVTNVNISFADSTSQAQGVKAKLAGAQLTGNVLKNGNTTVYNTVELTSNFKIARQGVGDALENATTKTGGDTYNGSIQTLTVSGYNSTAMTYVSSGTASDGTEASIINTEGGVTILAYKAGTYYITFSIADKNNYKWASTGDDVEDSKEVTYTLAIAKASVTISGLNDITTTYGTSYNAETATASNNGTVTYAYYGTANNSTSWTYTTDTNTTTTAPTLAGTYYVVATVAEGTNYSAATATATITIGRATITLTGGSSTDTYDPTSSTTLTVTYDGKEHNIYFTVSCDTDALDDDGIANVLTINGGTSVGYTYTVAATAAGFINQISFALDDENNYQMWDNVGNLAVKLYQYTLYINKATLTVTANDDTIAYGDAWTQAGGSGYTITGFVGGDTVSVVSGTATLSTTYTVGSDAGQSYYITVDISGLSAANYTFTNVSGTLTVTKRAITVTFSGTMTSVYGDAIATITDTVTVGSLYSNDMPYTYTVTFDNSTVTLEQGSDVGTYTIAGVNNNTTNYDITFIYSSGTAYRITQRAITVTIDNQSTVYGVDIVDPLTASVTTGSIYNNETVYTLSTTATSSSNVGTYDITGTCKNDNYDVTFVKGTYTITKATLTITAPSATASTTYGDLYTATYSITGLTNGDTADSISLVVTYNYDGYTQSSSTGDYYITVSSVTSASGNYNYVYSDYSVTLSVGKRAITVQISGDMTSVYCADLAAITMSVTDGTVYNGETPYSYTVTYGSANVTSTFAKGSVAGDYTITGVCTNSNYSIEFKYANGQTYTISPMTVTINNMSIDNWTYNGTESVLSYSVASNVTGYNVNNIGLVVTYTGTVNGGTANGYNSTTAPTQAGTYTVTITLSDDNNYRLATTYSMSYTIARATITLSGDNASYVYSGSANALTIGADGYNTEGISYSVVSNAYSGATASSYYNGTSVVVTATDAGTYTLTFKLIDSNNYQISETTSYTLTISKQTVTVPTASGSESVTYDGSAHQLVIATYDSKTMSVSGTATASGSSLVLAGTDAGTYTVTISLSDTYNYEWASGGSNPTFTLTITSAGNAISGLANVSTIYGTSYNAETGSANFGTITYLYTGTTNGGETYSSSVAPTEAGSYTLTATVTGNNNYAGATASITIVIGRLAVALPEISGNVLTYNGAAQSATVTGYDSAVMNVTGDCTEYGNSIVITGTSAGDYSVTVALSDTNNYEWASGGSNPTFTLTITSAGNAISGLANVSTIYGTSYNAETGSANFGTITYLYTGTTNGGETYSSSVAPTEAGSYTLTATVTGNNNYAGATASITIVIGRLAVALPEISGNVLTYNGAAQSATVTGYDSAVMNVTGDCTEYGNSIVITGTSAGDYSVTVALSDTNNYEWATTGSTTYTLTINALEVTITVTANDSVYGSVELPEVTTSSTLADSNITVLYTGTANDGSAYESDVAPTEAGEYSITLTLTDLDNLTLSADSIMEASYTIARKVVTLSGEDVTAVYDGTIHTLEVTGYDANAMAYVLDGTSYSGKDATSTASGTIVYVMASDAGEYTLTFELTDANNYTLEGVAEYALTISKATVALPVTGSETAVTYDGTAHLLEISGFNTAAMGYAYSGSVSISGDVITVSETHAGEYAITFSLKDTDNYVWADNAEDPVFSLTIAKATANGIEWSGDILLVYGTSYDAETATATYGNIVYAYYVQGETTALGSAPSDVGVYTVTATVAGTDDYVGATASITITINKAEILIEIPEITGNVLTYTGEAQSATITGYDSKLLGATGEGVDFYVAYNNSIIITETDAGSYTVTVYIIDTLNYMWSDGTTGAKTYTLTINRMAIDTPVTADGNITYDAASHTFTVTGYDAELMSYAYDGEVTANGSELTISATNAGTYTITFGFNTTNYCWSGTGSDEYTISWTIDKLVLTVPTSSSASFISGNESTYIPEGFDETWMDIEGNTASEAGDYTATVTLKDTENCVWANGTTDSISISWSISHRFTAGHIIMGVIIAILVALLVTLIVRAVIIKKKHSKNEGEGNK
ncbi:MAG: hypothetical protein LUD19_02885 [Clostridia bacterium]|nr:hypothetical protein [Clostridia bacterium]